MATAFTRFDRRRIRWFFAGLLVVSAAINIFGAFLVRHESRTQLLESILPSSVTLGGRTGVVLLSLVVLLLAGGVARGKRIAWQLTCIVLLASIAFDLLKDLDFEDAALSVWIVLGLWWMRHDFDADSDPASLRRGLLILAAGVLLAAGYAVGGTLLLGNQLTPRFGVERSLEHLVSVMLANPAEYRALTRRAEWFLGSIPIIAYGLVLIALTQVLRPALAPYAAASDRDRMRALLARWGRNSISRLAVHADLSFHWPASDCCVAFNLHGRTALVLGDPVGDPSSLREHVEDFVAYCERQDWIPAFYQVEPEPYRSLGMSVVSVGTEALVDPRSFGLEGAHRHDLRYAVRRCEKAGVSVTFSDGGKAWSTLEHELKRVSGEWLATRGGPELAYSLGTLSTLRDPDITVAVATCGGRVEGFVSWLPVPACNGWALDLMRRRPDARYGVMEALIVHSIREAAARGIGEVSLGLVPARIGSRGGSAGAGGLMNAVYWSVSRFQRVGSLHRFKEKFGPRWTERYLAVPNSFVLPEVLVALARAHLPRALPIRGGLQLLGLRSARKAA